MPGQNILGDCSANLLNSLFSSISCSVESSLAINGTCDSHGDFIYAYAASAVGHFTWDRVEEISRPCNVAVIENDTSSFKVCGTCCVPFVSFQASAESKNEAGEWFCDVQDSDPFNGSTRIHIQVSLSVNIFDLSKVELNAGFGVAIVSGEEPPESVSCNVGSVVVANDIAFLQANPATVQLNKDEIIGTHVLTKEDWGSGAYGPSAVGFCGALPTENETVISSTTITITIS